MSGRSLVRYDAGAGMRRIVFLRAAALGHQRRQATARQDSLVNARPVELADARRRAGIPEPDKQFSGSSKRRKSSRLEEGRSIAPGVSNGVLQIRGAPENPADTNQAAIPIRHASIWGFFAKLENSLVR